LSLAGGGTDVPPFCNENGSKVINLAINKFVKVEIEEIKNQFSLKKTADVFIRSTSGYSQPENQFAQQLSRSIEHHFSLKENLAITITNPVRPNSGLGTSSTMIVATLKALDVVLGTKKQDMDLIALALQIERIEMGVKGGFQDFFPAIFGGLNLINFEQESKEWTCSKFSITESFVSILNRSLFAIELGILRESERVIEDQIERSLNADSLTTMALKRQLDIVDSLGKAIDTEDFDSIVICVDHSYESKKNFSPLITNEIINQMESTLRAFGGRGIKVSGAGGGGHMFCFFPEGKPDSLVNAIPNSMKTLDFQFEQRGFREIT
jgi:D-glycero-alpha-D-manno-heptose-7-phosphate kinase